MNRAPLLLLLPWAAACGASPPPPHVHGDGAAHTHGDEAAHAPAEMPHRFDDVARFERSFEAPERAAWQRPEEVVQHLRVAPGHVVVDLGAGTGYFLPQLVPAVGPEGRILALDVEPNMVAYLTRRATEAGYAQVEARRVAPDDPGLPADSVDRVLIVNTWHHLEDRSAYAERLAQALRPGGEVLVVDFELHSPVGPPARHRLAAEVVARELRAGGLEVEVVEEALPHQYLVRGRAPVAEAPQKDP